MAFSSPQNIDPSLHPTSLTSPPPKQREAYQNGAPPSSYSPIQPIQPSPRQSYPQPMPPTPNYYANRPPSVQHESPETVSPGANPSDPNDIKRPRACEACRGLKVKCEFDDNNPSASCKRCAKAGRQCIVTAPSRKRQKKTDSRVAELEKKIDALTASLAARGDNNDVAVDPHLQHPPPMPPAPRPSIYPDQWGPKHPPLPPPPHQSPQQLHHGVKRKITDGPEYFGGDLHRPPLPPAPAPPAQRPSPTSVAPYPGMYSTDVKPKIEADEPINLDVIDQGLLTVHDARQCFERYVAEMCYHLPILVFPAGTLWLDVRKNKPMLFLAVLAVASGTILPTLQARLISELTKLLADRIVYRGEKSLEIVQTIQCMTTYYQPPEKYEELNFNQLIHIAAVMALDIGLGKRFKKGSLALWRPAMENKRPLPDPNSPETRRCWLGCYFMCCNSAMSLRRPLLIRWSPYADECIDILQNSPDAAPTDKWLCLMVRGQHIAEDIGLEFSMDDPASQLSLTDHKTQYHLRAFERLLQEWYDSASPEMLKMNVLRHTHGVVNLYMHEIAMHHNHNIDDFRPPFNTTPIDGPPDPDFVTPAHIESLTTCMNSVHEIFEAFLGLELSRLRALPTLFFVRNSYAAVALIKMYTAVSAKGSKFGSIIKTEDLKVDYYLDRLIATLTKTAEGGMCKVAHKFSLIFNMLRQWHVRRVEGSGSGDNSNPVSRNRTPLNGPKGTHLQPPQYQAVQPKHDPNTMTWNTQPTQQHGPGRPALEYKPSSHQPLPPPPQQQQAQPRNGLQMLSDAAMGPSPPQPTHPQPPHINQSQPQHQQPPQHWIQQSPMQPIPITDMQDPNMGMYSVDGMAGMDNLNLDMDLMAYGFGDEFVAMGWGAFGGEGGWGF